MLARSSARLPASSIRSWCHNSPRSRHLMSATSALNYPRPIVINPSSGAPTATVFFLHGLGDTGEGWSDMGPEFAASLKDVRFIFPTAPRRPITLNYGMSMPGWYDIPSLNEITSKEDTEGLLESKRYVEQLINAEVAAGIPSQRIVVCGFSQGGAIALLMLRSNLKLAGIVGLSTYLPMSKVPGILSDTNKDTPILMCHGDSDQVVAYQFGRESHSVLTKLGADTDFATFSGMGHSACPAEFKVIKEFLAKRLPPL
ncbi:Phospholipase/carboxylesterase/thioesterase [Haematococcus lacustris]